MKSTTKLSLLALLFIVFTSFYSNKANASHDMGGFISYTHVSGNTYHVTVTFFRDCSGITAPTSISVSAASVSCGFPATSTVLNLTGSQNSSPVCPSEILNTTCNGGALPGEELYFYEADITLAGNCADWIFSYTDCCLPGTVSNVVPNGMYFESTLNNLSIPNNNSPILTSPSMGYICVGLTSTYNFGAVDLDGDSLSYALVDALDAGPINMTYNPPYSGTNPMASTPAVSMDPITGDVVFNPTMIMGAVIAIRIYEYRNGVLIASHLRQMITQSITCTNNQPDFSGISNVTGGVQTGPFALSVCPGTPVTFEITASDVDALNNLVLSSVSTYPGSTFIQTGTNPATGLFSWTPSIGFIGTNIVVLSAADDFCPYLGRDFQSIMFQVTQTTYAGPDVIHCPAQGPLTLNAIGGTNFTWSVVTGDPVLSCTSCTSTTVNPTITTTYAVLSDLATCNNNDQVTVTVVPDFTFTVTPDASYCLPYFGSTPVSLTATPSPAGSYTYAWDEVGSAPWTAGIQSPTYTATQNTDIAVVVTSAAGCVLSDTMSITTTVFDDTPTWSLASSTIDPCVASSIDLTATVEYGAVCDQYSVAAIPFAPIASVGTSLALTDDQVSGSLPIGFNFNFYCNSYSNFYVSSNGFITFNPAAGSGCCSGGIVPSNDGANDIIAFAWNDLYPPGSGTITYETVGITPNQKLIVTYTNVAHCCGSTPPFNSGQIILNESDNSIEIHTTEISDDGSVVTQGIENSLGTLGITSPGLNSQNASLTNTAYRFTNAGSQPYLLTWEQPLGTPIGTSNPINVSPVAATTYYAVLTDVTGTCPSGTQSITVTPTADVTAPVADILTLTDVNGSCSVTSLTAPTATDNCVGSVIGTPDATLPITTTTLVTWTYTDGLGNSSTQTQNVIVADITPPVTPTLSPLTVDCTGTLSTPTTTDDCSGTITGTTAQTLSFVEGGSTTITWTFADGNGNSTTATQVYNYDDVTPPVTPTLLPVTVDCNGTLTAPTTTDVCAGTISGTTAQTLSFVEGGSTTITWTFDDGNGNTTSATQIYNYDDVIPPVTPTLLPVTVDCNGTLTAPTTTDVCAGTITGTTAQTLSFVEGGSTTITWTFADGNGNSTTATQVYNYDDITPPVTPTLTPLTVDCTGTLTAPTTTDVCAGTITGTTAQTLSFVEGGSTTITWTFADGNGNSTTATQVYNYDDVTPPVTPTLLPVTVDCNGTLLVPTTTDVCAGTITGTTAQTLSFVEGGSTTITWTFADGNGNSTTATQVYNYDDVTSPVTPTLSPVSVDCNGTLTSPTTTDVCAGTITGTTAQTLSFMEGGSTTITWTFADGNGNSTTATQIYNYDDVTPPVTPSISPLTIGCSGTLVVPSTTDLCAGTITGTTSDVLSFVDGGSTTVTWTFADGNGNSTTATQVYNYDDSTPPTAPILSNVTVDCNGVLVVPNIIDPCSGTIVGTTTDMLSFVDGGSTTVTWSFDDGNGNIVTSPQTYIYDDVTAPVTPSLSPLTVDCTGTLVIPTTTDVCAGTISGTTTDVLSFVEGGSTTITWTFDDGNGNSTTAIQLYNYDDVAAPVTTALVDFDGSCETPASAPSAIDLCAGVITGTTTDPLVYNTPGTYIVTWTFDDGNGNTSTSTQNIVVGASTTYATVIPDVCGSYTAPSGAIFTVSGTYTDIIPNALGCDSIITINLTLNPGFVTNMTAIYCEEYTVPSGSMTYYTSGIYNDTLMSLEGCDSVLIIDVTILQIDNSVSVSGITLTSNATADEYQWFNCANGINVPNGTLQSFTPIYNGTYAVVIFQNGCYDTSACVVINSADLLDEEDFKAINVYPNPSSGMFTLEGVNLTNEPISIFDMNGRLMQELIVKEDKTIINLMDKQRGVYFIRIQNEMIRIVVD